jgi:hypothetical protein
MSVRTIFSPLLAAPLRTDDVAFRPAGFPTMIGTFSGIGPPLVLLFVCACVGLTTHVVWTIHIGGAIWRSDRSTLARLGLIAIVAATPVVGFYAAMLIRAAREGLNAWRPAPAFWWISPFAGLLAIILCAQLSNLRYVPTDRGWSVFLGFVPGMLAFYAVMQLIIYMAAQVAGLSRHGVLATRTHLLSAGLIIAMAL